MSGSALGRWESAAWRTRSRGKEAYAAHAAYVLVPLPGRERAPPYDDVAHENLSRARMSEDQGRKLWEGVLTLTVSAVGVARS